MADKGALEDRYVQREELERRLALTRHTIYKAIERDNWERVPRPDAIDPYRWRLSTIETFLNRTPPVIRSSRGWRPHARQIRLLDRRGRAKK